MSLCSSMENVPMVSSHIEQHNQVKSGHTLRLELQDMLNSHGMRISQFQADSDASIEKHSTAQASNVVPEMNHVLGSKVDEVKVGSHQQEQLKPRPKLNFLNALKGSGVDDNEGSKTLGISSVRNLHFAPPTMTDGRVTVAPPLDVFEDGCEFWKSTLVGHFVGQKLPYPKRKREEREREKREREREWCCRSYIYSVHRWIILIFDYVVPSNLLSTLTERICYPINEVRDIDLAIFLLFCIFSSGTMEKW